MFSGLDDPDDDEGSIWDTGGIDLFGSSTSNGVTRVLSSSDCTVEELMRQDEFIQETQGRNSRLLALLSSPEGMDTLLYYLTTPQHPRNEDRAFRFPYMASEALCCKVDELLDAVVGVGKEGQEGRDAALCALFSLPAPGLRGSGGGGGSGVGTTPTHKDEVPRGTEDPFQLSQGIPHGTGFRSYLLGYWCKAVGVVCKTRPGPLLRFLDASPGIAAGLVPLLGNTSVAATLHASLLALPWGPPCALLATPHMTLAQGDPPHQGLPELLLGALEAGLLACSSGGGGSGPGAALAIAEGAASVLCALLTTSRASAPHSKFAEDGYNERRIAAALAIKLASTPPPLPPSVDPVAAATAALIAGPSAAELRGALDSENLALDSNFYSLEHRVEDSIHLRLLKVLRDDPHYVTRVVGILGLALGVVGTGKEGATSFTSQSAASHVFRVVACLVEVLGEGWWESVEECLRGGGGNGGGGGGGGEATTVSPRTPLLITQLCASGGMVERLSRHLLAECGRARGGAALASASASAPAPGAGAAPHPSSPNAPKLGLSGGLAVRLLVALTKCGWAECTLACSSAKAYTTLLSCMDSFPWHSVVHSAVAGGIITALSRVQTVCDRGSEGAGWVGGGSGNGGSSGGGAGSGGSSGGSGSGSSGGGGGGGGGGGVCAWGSQSLSSSIESLIVGSDLPQWVSDKVGVMAWPLALTSPKAPTLVGYGGHLLNTTNALLSAFASNALAALSPPSTHHMAGHTRFWTAVDGPIAVANVAHGVMLGGKLPPDVKASGVVGQNADAAPAPKGKAGSGGGGGGGEGGGGFGRDQGEEDEEKEWGEDEERKEAEDRAKRLAKLMRNSAATIGDYDDDDDGGLGEEDDEEEEEKEKEEKKRKGEESMGDLGKGHWDGFSAGGETLTISGASSSSTTTGSSFDDPFGDMDFGAAATSTTATTPAPQATVVTEDWGAF